MSGGAVRVRSAAAADVPRIVELERSVSEAPHWAEAEYRAIVEAADGSEGVLRCLLVAESGGQIAGFAVGKLLRFTGEAELESVAVAPELRRGGFGRTLCADVLAWCKERSAAFVELEVRAGSAGAIALYRSLGFLEVGLRPDYYSAPAEDAVLMRLELDGCGESALPVD